MNKKFLVLIIGCLLTLPALFINLGVMPYTSDEPTRAIVTMEMIWSGNLITPTFTGEYYYNKPPLYNWILIPFASFSSGEVEWHLRIPSILALFGFCLTIFLFTRKWFGNRHALVASLMYITCGRILFWDSMLGLIDIFYSWITFTGFVFIINGILKNELRQLYLASYLLAALGFLLKGMPSLVFQAITLITVFIATKKFRHLFSLWHFAGIALFLIIAGSYMWLYSRENSLQQLLSVLWDQSSQRTAMRKGFSDSIYHLLLFHPKMVYHFLPWSVFVVLLVFRPYRQKVSGWFRTEDNQNTDCKSELHYNQVLRLIILVFCANIIVYWLSPATIPRYVLMLAPLTFIPITILLEKSRVINIIIPLLVILMLSVRIVFNIAWLPEKAKEVAEYRQKNDALRISEITKGKSLQIVGNAWIDHSTIIYLMTNRNEPITREHKQLIAGNYYLTNEKQFARIPFPEEVSYKVIDSTFIRHQNLRTYLLTFDKNIKLP